MSDSNQPPTDPTPPTTPLLRFLLANDLSQADVATRVGVHPTTVSRWCSGELVPTEGHAKALERAIGLPVTHWSSQVLRLDFAKHPHAFEHLHQIVQRDGYDTWEECVATLLKREAVSDVPHTIQPADGIYLVGDRFADVPQYAMVVMGDNDLWATVEPMAVDAGREEAQFVRRLLKEEVELSLRSKEEYQRKTRARLVEAFGEGEELEERMARRFGASRGGTSQGGSKSKAKVTFDPDDTDHFERTQGVAEGRGPKNEDLSTTPNLDIQDMIEEGEVIEAEFLAIEPTDEPTTPYDRIVTLAAWRGMTRTQLAEKAGVTKETIYNLQKHTAKWEKSGRKGTPPGVREENLTKLAATLATTPTWLLTGALAAHEEHPIDREQERSVLLKALAYERANRGKAAERKAPRELNPLEQRGAYLVGIIFPGTPIIVWNDILHRGRLALARNRLHPREVDAIVEMFGCTREWIMHGRGEAPSAETVRETWRVYSERDSS
jgi:transcriptional regulator with XRE-family HTH domain